jgi:GNAT superfamily N-acetyltransferase
MDPTYTYRFNDYTIKISALKILYHFIPQLRDELTQSEKDIVLSAYREDNVITTTIEDNETNELIAFAVHHKVDFDPYNNHTTPFCLDFIYTFKKYRKQGFGLALLKFFIQYKIELTAFITDKLKQKFFKKGGFILMGAINKCYVMQTPKLNNF